MVNFIYKLKLNCRDLRRARYDVIKQLSKLHVIVEYSFLFSLVQES